MSLARFLARMRLLGDDAIDQFRNVRDFGRARGSIGAEVAPHIGAGVTRMEMAGDRAMKLRGVDPEGAALEGARQLEWMDDVVDARERRKRLLAALGL